MKFTRLAIPDVVLLEPRIFEDERGFFFESFNQREVQEVIGSSARFVQDNHSYSKKNVVRGLHYQLRQPQGKLVRVISGRVFDVAVDIRKSSPTFGHWIGETLSAENKKQLWIPAGFAHGFMVLSDYAEVLYKTTDYWASDQERCIIWDDQALAIQWPIQGMPTLSNKDRQGVYVRLAEVFE